MVCLKVRIQHSNVRFPPPPAAVSVPFLSLIELDIIILISDVEI